MCACVCPNAVSNPILWLAPVAPSSLLGLNGTGGEPEPLGAGLTPRWCPHLNWLLLLLFHTSNYPPHPLPATGEMNVDK